MITEGNRKEDYNKLVNKKINDVENIVKEAENIINNDLLTQKNKFYDNLCKKKMKNDVRKSPTPLNIKRKTVMFPVNESPSNIYEFENKIKMTTNQPNSERLNKRIPTILKVYSNNNKKHSISDTFDDYFKKFHYLYFHTFSEKKCIEVIEKINENYKEKLECFIYFEDQIKELELLTTGDSGNSFLTKIIMNKNRL